MNSIADRVLGSRVGRTEFFTILPSGFFLTLVFIICFVDIKYISCYYYGTPSNILMLLILLIESMKGHVIAYFTFGLFLSHLFGSIVIGISVMSTEKFADLLTFSSSNRTFPYSEYLREKLRGFKYHKEEIDYIDLKLDDFPKIKKDLDQNVYNLWKDILFWEKPELFSYYQNCETKSRFASCMVWAGILGILIGSMTLAFNYFWGDGSKLFLMIQVIAGSIILTVPFAIKLHSARRKEVDTLLHLIIAYVRKENRKKMEKQPKSENTK